MDQPVHDIIRQIHSQPTQAALVVSGAGSLALAWLLGVPGASRTVLEVTLPYSYSAFERFIGFRPRQFVSVETAQIMAETAYRRARLLAVDGLPSVGLACTATIVTDRPKRGEHRAHVAVWDERGVACYVLVLAKGRRDRTGEEEVVSRLIIYALARACGIDASLDMGLLPGEVVQTGWRDAPDRILQVLRGELAAVMVDMNRQVSLDLPRRRVILPGAFNPLHAGHIHLAHVAGQLAGLPICYELSIRNVDKSPLLEADIRQRLEQFAGQGDIAITSAPLFEQKAALFPNCVFVVGFDTATRLVNPRYYGGREQAMLESLAKIRAAGCRFLVAGRLYEDRFRTLREVAIPPGFEDMFTEIPPDLFRADVSSTELRTWRAQFGRGQQDEASEEL